MQIFMLFLQDDIMLPDRILYQYEAAKNNRNTVSIVSGYSAIWL